MWNYRLILHHITNLGYVKSFFSRFPKVWKSEITVENTNKQGWIARCMILCSRTSWLPFLKNLKTKDVISDKQSPDVENSVVEFDSSKVFFSVI